MRQEPKDEHHIPDLYSVIIPQDMLRLQEFDEPLRYRVFDANNAPLSGHSSQHYGLPHENEPDYDQSLTNLNHSPRAQHSHWPEGLLLQ